MNDFTVRTAQQLPALIQGFRKQAGLTQTDTALRLGITQQTLSALERNADKVSAERLLRLMNILGVELVLRQPNDTPPHPILSVSNCLRRGSTLPISNPDTHAEWPLRGYLSHLPSRPLLPSLSQCMGGFDRGYPIIAVPP